MISGQGATATVWTPDLLQTLAQGRQVTVFTNRGDGFSTDTEETQNGTVAGAEPYKLVSQIGFLDSMLEHACAVDFCLSLTAARHTAGMWFLTL